MNSLEVWQRVPDTVGGLVRHHAGYSSTSNPVRSMTIRRAATCRVLLLLLFTSGLARPGLGQPGQPASERRVAGVVRHAESRLPLPDVTLAADGRRTASDRDGRFDLRVPAGVVALEVSAADFYPLSTAIDVTAGDAVDIELLLVPRTSFASTIDVVAPPPPESAPSAVVVAPIEVLRTPGALDNVFRTLHTLPGVSATEEFSSRLAVRGGAPDQNLTIMDSVEIHDPYRLFGLTSAFNPETISRFELATGGFSVKYGDRLSSLLVIENRTGVKRGRLNGSAALSLSDANIILEGGMPRNTNGSWLISARRTYYDLVASRLADQEFPRFADLQAKGVWELAPGRTLSVFGLRSRQDAALDIDSDEAQGEFNDDTSNDLASVRLDATLGRRGRSNTTVAYSDSTSSFRVNAAFENRSQRANSVDDNAFDVANVVFDRLLALGDVSLRQELGWTVGAHLVEAGGELHRLGTELSFEIRGDRNPSAANGSSQQGGAGLPDSLRSIRDVIRGGLWLLDRWQATPAVGLEAGVRLDRSGINRDTQLSPRVTVTWGLGARTRVRSALGRYTQSPGYEKLVQGDYVLDLTGEGVGRLRSEEAVNASAGIERDIGTATLRVEGYYKRSSRLLVGRLETEAERQARLAQYDFPASLVSSVPTDPIITSTPTNDGRGRAYGFDVFLSRMTAPVSARVRGWASYTWGRATRESYGRILPFEYDRRHAFSAVASYRLSDRWELAATTRVASGFPRTPPLGVRVASEPDTADRDRDGNVSELIPAADPAGRSIYSVNFGGVDNLNAGRLPVFSRVDLRATWRPRGAQGRWELYAEVINLLNRTNAGALEAELQYDPAAEQPKIVEQRDQGIPRLPTIGLRVNF
jgi:hypothetical protein